MDFFMSVVLFPKTYNRSLVISKTSDKSQLVTFYKISNQNFSKLTKSSKNGEYLSHCHFLKKPRRHDD